MLENQKKKEQDFKKCREEHFINKIMFMMGFIVFLGGIGFIFPDPIFQFIPILSSISCQLV